jgi:signal transduction histidine kinase
MNRFRLGSLRQQISALFILFGLILATGLAIQGSQSQQLIVHPIWEQLLRSSTAQYLSNKQFPTEGLVRGRHLHGNEVPAGMPAYFAALAPGYYDEEQMDEYDPVRSYAVLVTPLGPERIVMSVNITELENYQNMSAMVSACIAVLSAMMIAGSILWVYRSMRRPIQSLAQRMDELDPAQPSLRLDTSFALRELHDIAVLVNRHLDRVERFIERERSLLDQASHEFGTPIAVIAGAVDVLKLYQLPPAANAPLERIQATTDHLTEIMSALLFLSREDGKVPVETTRLDALIAVLVEDHQHLLDGKPAKFIVGELQPLWIDSPEAILRIVVGNLLRNAAENRYEGAIEVKLADGCLSIQDSGTGFDTVAAARRYTQALRDSTKHGGGQGLGLFLTRRICERFGWTLKISSTPAQGTLAEMAFIDRDDRP